MTNPDFEFTLPGGRQLGWSTYQRFNGSVLRTIQNSSIAHSGTNCVEIEQTIKSQHNFASWFQDVPAHAGVTYRFAFWIKTENVKPSVAFTASSGPDAFGFVTFLDREGVNIPSTGQYYESPNVFMTHDWKRFEISFVTPDRTGYVRILLALANAIGTVFFDSVSLVPSSFMKLSSPAWLREAVVYQLGPWEFAQFGNGSAFRGIVARLPQLQALGVNTLYLLPIWADQGWYSVTDFFAIYKGYGTQDDFRTLVREAHNHGMRVLLDFCGTIGVPPDAIILQQHPDWLILNENNSAYYSWTWPGCDDTCLRGIDTNRPDVQDFFVQVAKYYVQMFNIDGYRCDSASASPYEMFEKIRTAIQAVKPDAVLIGEESPDQPIYHESAFDATFEYSFPTFVSSLPNSMSANKTASWLTGEINSYPPGALKLSYLEDHDFNYTAESKYGPAGYQAFAAFIFTVDGVPMIYNGQEVGNLIAQPGPWVSMDWNANPQAAQFTSFYTKLIHIRLTYPALQRGATVPVNSTNGRVAAYARVLAGADPVLVVINFSNSSVNTTLGTSLQALGLQSTPLFVNTLDNREYPVVDIRSFNLSLEPYQEYILVPSTAIVRTETHTPAPIVTQSSTILGSVYSSTVQTSPGLGLPMSSFIEYFVVITVLAAIGVGSILISRRRAKMPTKARENTKEVKAKKGVQFPIN